MKIAYDNVHKLFLAYFHKFIKIAYENRQLIVNTKII